MLKHIFVINPAAGKYDHSEEIRNLLKEHGEGFDYSVYVTKGHEDAVRFIGEWCDAHPNEEVRFYACGGDGTIHEVAQAVCGRKNASFTAYPCGSGNDFVKYYGGKSRFADIPKLLRANEKRIDAISVNGHLCVNTVSFGFDSAVCKMMQKIKRYPLIGGKNAYYVGAFLALFYAMRTKCCVCADGEEIAEKEILLCTVANGRYVGGSFKCAPRSMNDDGLLEVCCVKPIFPLRFFTLIGPYSRGEHLDAPKFRKIVTYRQSKKVEIHAKGDFWLSLDGELINQSDTCIEVIPGALRFAVPEN